jgi:hypothetical protein
VFHVYRTSGMTRNTRVKFDHWNVSGQTSADSACRLLMSAVRTTNTSGMRNMAATAISRAWSPTASRRWRRRTAAGGRTRSGAPGGRERVTEAIGDHLRSEPIGATCA